MKGMAYEVQMKKRLSKKDTVLLTMLSSTRITITDTLKEKSR